MSGFKHKIDKPKALNKAGNVPHEIGTENLEELAKYAPESINQLVAAGGFPASLLPRAGISKYDTGDLFYDWIHFGTARKPHPAKRKTHVLQSGRRTNEFIRKYERPAKKQHWKLPRKSLFWLADELNRSHRQVRRYCEMGLIPGAYRTKGGHWRVRSGRSAIIAVRHKLRGFWRALDKARYRSFINSQTEVERIRRKINVAYSLNQVANNKIKPKDAMEAAKHAEYLTRLFVAAKKIFAKKHRLTASTIASELNISRSSLYRYFRAAEIKSAIREARERALKANFNDEY